MTTVLTVTSEGGNFATRHLCKHVGVRTVPVMKYDEFLVSSLAEQITGRSAKYHVHQGGHC